MLAGWLGWLAVLAGALSIAVGIDVGHAGLSSGFQDVAGPLLQLVLAGFVIGILVAGFWGRATDTAVPIGRPDPRS